MNTTLETEQLKTSRGEIMTMDQFQSPSFRHGAYDVTYGAGNMDKAGNRWVCYGYQGGFAMIRMASAYTTPYGNTYYR
jgi:hypothetical protein